MIAYVTLGTNDLDGAASFYDELLKTLGAGRAMENDRLVMYTTAPGDPMFALIKPHNEKEATVGNGTMVSLKAGSREQCDAVYKKALELGATDEGPLGERGPGFYAGYFRDPQGNKLNVVCIG